MTALIASNRTHRYTTEDSFSQSPHSQLDEGGTSSAVTGTPIRASGTGAAGQDTHLVSWASGIAAGLFATLFPSDCRFAVRP